MKPFSLLSKPKPSSKPTHKSSQIFNEEEDIGNNEEETKPQLITEFQASEALTEKSSKKLVIPPIPNKWRPEKTMRSLDSDIHFELEGPSAITGIDSGMRYGLNIRSKDGDDDSSGVGNSDPGLRILKEQLKNLPDDPGFEEYVDVPVEAFAKALLAGYGWSEGKGIGRNTKEDVKVVQFERRAAGREGLGFDSMKHGKEEGKIVDPVNTK